MTALETVRRAIREATLPKIAVPPVLTEQEWRVARRLARTLRVPTVEETAEAMRIEIPLPEMPEPRVFPRWQPSYPSPSPWWRRRQERTLEAERRGSLVVLSAPEVRPARTIERIFADVLVGDRNRAPWALPDLADRFDLQRYTIAGVPVESYQVRFVSETFDVPEEMLRPRRVFTDPVVRVLYEIFVCPCESCTEWRQQPPQTEEERIDAAGERYRNRSTQDFLDYSARVLDDWESSDAYRWAPPDED